MSYSRGGSSWNSFDAVLGRVLFHDGHGQNDGHVVGGLGGQNAARAQFPEIGVSGTLHGLFHRHGTAIVGRDGQVPVAELVIEIAQVVGGGAGGLLGIHAVVGVGGLLQAVLIAAPLEELPHAAGGGARYGARDETGFRLRQVNDLLRNAFFVQDALNHGPVAARALQSGEEGLVAAIGEVIDVAQHGVVDREGQLGSGGGHLFLHFVLQLGIHRESHLQNIFERCFFELSLVHDGGRA